MRSLRLRVVLGVLGTPAGNPALPASAGSVWSGGHGPAPGTLEPDEVLPGVDVRAGLALTRADGDDARVAGCPAC